MKGKLDNNIIDSINYVLNEFYNKNTKDVQVIVDVNPNNMM